MKQIIYFRPADMVRYDEFGFELQEPAEVPAAAHIPIRQEFPPAGSNYLGGNSDGWEYRTVFAGSKLAYSYEMVKNFLREEGYGDIPLPETTDDLRRFRRPRTRQIQLFAENGYIHNPVKILFPADPRQRHALILCVYNEREQGHLLRFHGV